MISTPGQQRSVIDEIREEIELDNYYRQFEASQKDEDCDHFNDSQSECDFTFESFYE
tara:strand:- start:418 stop:588 length:171 start_codon:yes stop_codon:yes gene_type:complete